MLSLKLALLFWSSLSFAGDGLTPAQQTELLTTVQQLKQEVQALRREVDQLRGRGTGIRTQDLEGRTLDNLPSTMKSKEFMGDLPPEMLKDVNEQLQKMKSKQQENNKLILELEKDM